MGILQIAITLALALFVRRQWPGIVWLLVLAVSDVLPFFFLDTDDPRLRLLMPHLVLHLIVYGMVRAIRFRKDLADDMLWVHGVWQIGSISTAIYLIFFDGIDYNGWNWIFLIPLNLFLAEIWPIYWIVLGPIFG